MSLSTTALAQYDVPKLAQENKALRAALRHAQERIHALENEMGWIHKLLAVPASIMSPSHKVTLCAAVKAYQQGTPDANGLVQIESWKLCKTVGQSRQTFLDNLTYCAEQLGILTKKRERLVESDTNDYTTNLYIGVTPLLAHPYQYKVEQPRNHGGERQLCPHCHSDRLQRKVTITCMQCGSILDEKISLVNQGSHLDVSPESQIDHSTNEHMPVDQEPIPDTNVNLTSIKTNVLESQRDDSAMPQQEPATPPGGEAVNSVNIPDTQRQEPSPTDDSDLKSEFSSHDEQHQAQPVFSTTDTLSQADILAHAATLLVEIAGPEPVHIEMSDRGQKKYYDVKRAITEQDTCAHLNGWKTKGASLRHPGGMTRALCYDADTPHDWQTLQTAARFLTYGDFCPILEPSPVQDGEHRGGGHLWIIFTDLVKATWAYQRAWQYAPQLRTIQEAWPGPANHKVRLPGGKYVKPGFAQWCQLVDAYGKPLATDGQSAARVLLDSQTSADIVPEYPEQEDIAEQMSRDVGQSPGAAKQVTHMCLQPGVDQHWQDTYSRSLWFQFTPAQLAAWYNEHHQIEDILPREKNGMGLASWRGEHTASVGLREDGWVDFGASARRADGKQDGGDALELYIRVSQQPRAEVFRQLGRQLREEAAEALESAAQRGEQPPQWVQAFMSPAGWERYHQLRQEADYPDEATTAIPEPAPPSGGVAGFYPLANDTPVSHTHPGQGQRQLRASASAVPVSNLMQVMAMLEAIRDYGQAHAWAALVIDGAEIISAGRFNWLHYVLALTAARPAAPRVRVHAGSEPALASDLPPDQMSRQRSASVQTPPPWFSPS